MSEYAEYPKAVGAFLALNAEHEATLLAQIEDAAKAGQTLGVYRDGEIRPEMDPPPVIDPLLTLNERKLPEEPKKTRGRKPKEPKESA